MTEQHVYTSYPGGIVGRIGFAIHGSDVSAARRRFIARVDATCSGTYRLLMEAEGAAVARNGFVPDARLLNDADYVELHARQYQALVRLGQPPPARPLYDAWLADFRQRVLVERQVVILEARGQTSAAKRAAASVDTMKGRGNLLGQEFGLVGCTSNGDRTPEPILDDGQPLPLP